MKKIFLGCVVVLISMAGRLSAQTGTITDPADPRDGRPTKGEIYIDSYSWDKNNTQGTQSLPIPGGRGTLQFTNNDDKVSNVVFINAAGKRFNLLPSNAGTNGAPRPSCKYPLPDACFATADKSIGMCICKPTDLNSGGYTVTIKGLLSSIATTTVSGAH